MELYQGASNIFRTLHLEYKKSKAYKQRRKAYNRKWDDKAINMFPHQSDFIYQKRLKKQNYRCAICKEKWDSQCLAFHADHDHVTGKFRGLLCHYCNCMLGFAKDDIRIIMKGIKYLKKWQNQG